MEAENDVADAPDVDVADGETSGDLEFEPDEVDGEDDGEEVSIATRASLPPEYPGPPCTLTVSQGDCLVSLAARYGMSEERIWGAARNADLRERRKHPNQLAPGDCLYIPAREPKEVTVATDRQYLVRVNTRCDCRLALRLLRGGRPCADLAYRLTVDGTEHAGRTDGDGERLRTPGW
jgi:hypothetical protein